MKNLLRVNRRAGQVTSVLLLLGIFGCSTVQNLVNIKKPNVSIENVRLTGMSLNDLDLAVALKVDNPNQLTADLEGFDFDFQINQSSFLKGQQDNPQTIEAMKSSSFEVPLKINFKDLYSTYSTLKSQDNSTYKIDFGLAFNLPVLGKTRIPVSHEGEFPLIKVPSVKISTLKINKLNLTGADVALELEIDNPNAFGFSLKSLDYNFQVNGQEWAQGLTNRAVQIAEKGKGTLSIPVSLNFLEMGQTVFRLLSGDNTVNYNFDGKFALDSSLPLLKDINLPVTRAGELVITR